MFILLTLTSASLLAARSLSTALLIMVNAKWLSVYIGGDLMIYLTQKILRNDFFYWIPLEGVLDFIVSFLMRVIVKVIADNTCIVQLRHPNEEGGIYWSLSMVAAFVVTLGSVYFFGTEREELMGDASDLSMDFLWSVTLGLAGVWMISFASLLALMEPKYRRTFVSTQTSWQWTQSLFKDGKADAVRAWKINEAEKLLKEHRSGVA